MLINLCRVCLIITPIVCRRRLWQEIARISYKRDVLPDPMTQRNEKIARFKLDKQARRRSAVEWRLLLVIRLAVAWL